MLYTVSYLVVRGLKQCRVEAKLRRNFGGVNRPWALPSYRRFPRRALSRPGSTTLRTPPFRDPPPFGRASRWRCPRRRLCPATPPYPPPVSRAHIVYSHHHHIYIVYPYTKHPGPIVYSHKTSRAHRLFTHNTRPIVYSDGGSYQGPSIHTTAIHTASTRVF